MKLNGKLIEAVTEVVVIPRPTGDLVFKAKPVVDYEAFENICVKPVPPNIKNRDQTVVPDLNDETYKGAMAIYAERRIDWMILQSLTATEGLEWTTVTSTDPSTWSNYRKEMIDAGLAVPEINRIIGIVIDANGLNERKIDEATKAFLASQAVRA